MGLKILNLHQVSEILTEMKFTKINITVIEFINSLITGMQHTKNMSCEMNY